MFNPTLFDFFDNFSMFPYFWAKYYVDMWQNTNNLLAPCGQHALAHGRADQAASCSIAAIISLEFHLDN
jgi:hypothetical protein